MQEISFSHRDACQNTDVGVVGAERFQRADNIGGKRAVGVILGGREVIGVFVSEWNQRYIDRRVAHTVDCRKSAG